MVYLLSSCNDLSYYAGTVGPLNNGHNSDDCFCPLNGGCPLFRGY